MPIKSKSKSKSKGYGDILPELERLFHKIQWEITMFALSESELSNTRTQVSPAVDTENFKKYQGSW
ncbi:MAG: hypothetical protein ACJARQ_000323 [Oleispira sp.]